MNPLLKVLLKQIEDNHKIITDYAMHRAKYLDDYDAKMHVAEALKAAKTGVYFMKEIVEELL